MTGSGPPLSAFCRICPREENYLCSSQIRPLKVGGGRVEEANFDHVEFKLINRIIVVHRSPKQRPERERGAEARKKGVK